MEKNSNTIQALYVFSGKRKKRFVGISSQDYPDTQFYGMSYLKDFGVDAEYKEFEEYPFGALLAKVFGFRLKHSLMYFVARKYDVVFGISVLYMLIWKKIFPTKTKFVIFNSVFSRMLTVHKKDSFTFMMLVWLLNDTDGVVFLSRADMKKVGDHIPNIIDRLFFVPMGVDAKYIQPQYEGREDFFLSVGRDNARDYKTIALVAKRLPEREFHFVPPFDSS